LVLLTAQKGAPPELTVQSPLVLHSGGGFTREVQGMLT
jgi:tRNA1(Val) A37 N6-methylase TrmN6